MAKLKMLSGPLAQAVEHRTFNPGVAGSSPAWLTSIIPTRHGAAGRMFPAALVFCQGFAREFTKAQLGALRFMAFLRV